MDSIKIAIFVGAFIALFLLMRLISASSDKAPTLPAQHPIDPMPLEDMANTVLEDSKRAKSPATVGADIPFPLLLPELELRNDGTYNRPEFLNYYFPKIDLLLGPADPSSFCDEFFVETRDPKDERISTYKYIVATPAGLQQEMSSERLSVIHFEEQMIIVSRWDLKLILDTAVQDITKTYGGWARYEGEHALPADDEDA